MDFWLSNYPSSKTVFLLIITGILIAVGSALYLLIDQDVRAYPGPFHEALWSSWVFVVTQSASDQDGFLGRIVVSTHPLLPDPCLLCPT